MPYQTSLGQAASARILLVDDDPLVRRTIAQLLEVSGHEVNACASGLEVPEIIERGTTDLVILDVVMPRMSGIEVCRRIKRSELGRRTPVVLLTALGSTEDVIAGLEAGADEFLTKPIEPVELEVRVRALLRFQRVQAQTAQATEPLATAASSLPELLNARVENLANEGGLSPREREVLDFLLLGRTNEQIASALNISQRTVKFHQANLLRKLGADSRMDLLRLLL